MGIVTLDGSLELLRLGPASHGEKIPQEEWSFYLGGKIHPQISLGNQGSIRGFPSTRIPDIKDPKTQGQSHG